uniref:Putative mitochondrial saccharopine dehydrogenase-like oxidoreductase At5g39410 n=1 Tax=Rhizophora mucronata TaxID=61149 RepID=A0A2P2QND7_RHIMU
MGCPSRSSSFHPHLNRRHHRPFFSAPSLLSNQAHPQLHRPISPPRRDRRRPLC